MTQPEFVASSCGLTMRTTSLYATHEYFRLKYLYLYLYSQSGSYGIETRRIQLSREQCLMGKLRLLRAESWIGRASAEIVFGTRISCWYVSIFSLYNAWKKRRKKEGKRTRAAIKVQRVAFFQSLRCRIIV